jgi:hypothetical protein
MGSWLTTQVQCSVDICVCNYLSLWISYCNPGWLTSLSGSVRVYVCVCVHAKPQHCELRNVQKDEYSCFNLLMNICIIPGFRHGVNEVFTLLWCLIQCWLIVSYWRFTTVCQVLRSHLSTAWPLTMALIGCLWASVTTTQFCVTSQKSSYLIKTYYYCEFARSRASSTLLGSITICKLGKWCQLLPSSVRKALVSTANLLSFLWSAPVHWVMMSYVGSWYWGVWSVYQFCNTQ